MRKVSRPLRYFCGYDTFIRHRCLAELAHRFDPSTILDVGGEGFLNLFVKAKVVTINVKEADVRYSGVCLPFKDGSFDVAVSSDTLEHLPKPDRPAFCAELLRASRKGIALGAPFGTPEHIEAEKKVAAGLSLEKGVRHYLNEHIRLGLPTTREIDDLRVQFRGIVYYQGDFREIRTGPSGKLSRYVGLIRAGLKNGALDLFWNKNRHLSTRWMPFTNRFFLLIRKNGGAEQSPAS